MLESVVVLDACVLYSAALRDFLMRLATARLYFPRWTDAIHDEWTRSLLADRATIPPAELARTRRLMNAAIPEAQVTGYESRIETLILPDAGDRHVLAAALESKASAIITFNLKHFPAARLAPYGITALHPDGFAHELLLDEPADFVQAVQAHRASLLRPPKTADEYLAALTRAQLPQTAAALRPHTADI